MVTHCKKDNTFMKQHITAFTANKKLISQSWSYL